MKNTIIILGLMGLTLFAQGQDTLLQHPIEPPIDSIMDAKEFSLSASSQVVFLSNGISSQWLRSWGKGGEITREQNTKQWSKLSHRSSTLALANTQVQIFAPLFSDSIQNQNHLNEIGLQVGQYQVFRGVYDPGLFQLIFLGNKGLGGNTLQGKDLEMEHFQYRSIGVHWTHGNLTNASIWQMGIDWVESSSYARWFVPEYKVYFSPSMENVTADYRIKRQSLTPGTKGIGVSGNFQWQQLSGPIYWKVAVRDLGFVKYNQLNTDVWKGNGTFVGFNTQTLQSADSLESFLAPYSTHNKRTESRMVALPASLIANFEFFSRWHYGLVYYFGGQWGFQSLGRSWKLEKLEKNYFWSFKCDALHSMQNQWGLQATAQWVHYNGWSAGVSGNNWLRTAAGNAPFFGGQVFINMTF